MKNIIRESKLHFLIAVIELISSWGPTLTAKLWFEINYGTLFSSKIIPMMKPQSNFKFGAASTVLPISISFVLRRLTSCWKLKVLSVWMAVVYFWQNDMDFSQFSNGVFPLLAGSPLENDPAGLSGG